jgi:hypothetical protein
MFIDRSQCLPCRTAIHARATATSILAHSSLLFNFVAHDPVACCSSASLIYGTQYTTTCSFSTVNLSFGCDFSFLARFSCKVSLTCTFLDLSIYIVCELDVFYSLWNLNIDVHCVTGFDFFYKHIHHVYLKRI